MREGNPRSKLSRVLCWVLTCLSISQVLSFFGYGTYFTGMFHELTYFAYKGKDNNMESPVQNEKNFVLENEIREHLPSLNLSSILSHCFCFVINFTRPVEIIQELSIEFYTRSKRYNIVFCLPGY